MLVSEIILYAKLKKKIKKRKTTKQNKKTHTLKNPD